MMRPLFLEFPEDLDKGDPLDTGRQPAGEFLLGPDLLVAPGAYPDKISKYRPLLPGTGWYDFWTGERVPKPNADNRDALPNGNEENEVPPDPTLINPTNDRLPVYVRPGSILPMQAVVQSTGEIPPAPWKCTSSPRPSAAKARSTTTTATPSPINRRLSASPLHLHPDHRHPQGHHRGPRGNPSALVVAAGAHHPRLDVRPLHRHARRLHATPQQTIRSSHPHPAFPAGRDSHGPHPEADRLATPTAVAWCLCCHSAGICGRFAVA